MNSRSERLRQTVVKQAQKELEKVDDIQVDDKATVKFTEDGYWVQAWLWLPPDQVTTN